MALELPEDRGTFQNFAAHLDPAFIDEALSATGTASIRRRKLPASCVAWLVIGMGLFRDLAIPEIVRELDLSLLSGPGKKPMAASSIHAARKRMGSRPLEWLFNRTAEVWSDVHAEAAKWKGRLLVGVDGSSVRVPDSKANAEHFGKRKNNRGTAAYPLVRMVTLMALRTHLLLAACLDSYEETSELGLADGIWSRIPPGAIALVDRLYLLAQVLLPLEMRGVDWVSRGKKNTSAKRTTKQGPCDWLVELNVTHEARARNPSLPQVWVARQLRYQRKGFRPQLIYTSLLDPKRYPAEEVVALYHERWELELGYDEVKTEMLEREEAIRSQSPESVYQEMWGLLTAFNLVRLEMIRIAQVAGVEPRRLSFTKSFHHVRRLFRNLLFAAPGAIPKRLEISPDEAGWFVLPPRRSERRFPRAVKIKMSHYARKRSKTKTRSS